MSPTPPRVRRLAGTVPVTFMVFDVLHLDNGSTLDRPYLERAVANLQGNVLSSELRDPARTLWLVARTER